MGQEPADYDVRSRRKASDVTAKVAVAEVQRVVVRNLRWSFIKMDGDNDYGVDAQVEVGDASGRLLALQIKGGRSYFDRPAAEGWWYYASATHVRYWTNYSLPVVLVMHHPDSDLCYWQLISQRNLVQTSNGGGKLLVPRANLLDETAKEALAAIADGGKRSDERLIKTRRRQLNLRQKLLMRYGTRCAVTGISPVELLEAAHIAPSERRIEHGVDDSALLRADIHRLFDAGLMAVDPETWRVVLAPKLHANPAYADLAGAPFAEGPSPEAIRRHFNEVTTFWD
ncbi:DUF4365 domain-containing protein [Lentzea sp. HUAS TT2]|uniref:DUF4365 domain-containing protein n=1 Tax=Lentzea sp. HUAS TT2 TaxID=3447454 RepID=UPI003F714B1A